MVCRYVPQKAGVADFGLLLAGLGHCLRPLQGLFASIIFTFSK